MTVIAMTTIRELESRVNDGIHVRLLWCTRERRVSVAVNDTKSGEAFSLQVGDDERALDVFHHPYAYAALHGVAPTRVWDASSDEQVAA
jgi:hypothetical protein